MTTIGVVGYGTVGRAVAHGFMDKGYTVFVNDVKNTPKEWIPLNIWRLKKTLLINCDIIFICVGTPPNSNGRMEDGYLLHALNEFADLDEAKPCDKLPIFVIKSTVLPGTTVKLEKSYPRFKFAVNPEFLRAKTAYEDFLEPDRIIVGGRNKGIRNQVEQLYESWDCPKFTLSTTEAELIKYLSNAYLVMKVAFACEMQRLCNHYNVKDMIDVCDGVVFDERINDSHLDPTLGPIPRNSHCLPKDLLALIKALEEDGVDTSYLQAVFDGGVER